MPLLALIAAIGLGAPWKTRQEFIDAYNSLGDGKTKAEVRAVLGPPDDVVTEADPNLGWWEDSGPFEVWRYGTTGHLTVATLGSLQFDKTGRTMYNVGISGYKGDPSVKEDDLRKAVRIMDLDYPRHSIAPQYDPLTSIRIATRLQAFDKQTILAALMVYQDCLNWDGLTFEHYEQISAALQLVFEPTEPSIGRANMVDDIPFLGFLGGGGTGLGPNFYDAIERYGKLGRLHLPTPAPPSDPIGSLSRWVGEDREKRFDLAKGFEPQLALLLRTVWLRPGITSWNRDDFAVAWARAKPEVASLRLLWDPSGLRYTRPDGTYFEQPDPTPSRFLWRPASMPHTKIAIEHVSAGLLEAFVWRNDAKESIQITSTAENVTIPTDQQPTGRGLAAVDLWCGACVYTLDYREKDPIVVRVLRSGEVVESRTFPGK